MTGGSGLGSGRGGRLAVSAGGFADDTPQEQCLGVGSRDAEGGPGAAPSRSGPPARISVLLHSGLNVREGRGLRKRPCEEGQSSPHRLMGSVPITVTADHLITDFPTNSY